MKLRSFFNILAVSVLVLLLIGGSGFYWLMAQNPLNLLRGGWEGRPAAAMFVPKQAIAMVSLLVKPDRLESLQQVTAQPRDRRVARAELEQFQQSLLANTDLDYAQDIRPWLGEELTFAVTSWDIDRDDLNGQQPGYLWVAKTQDAARSRVFLQVFWQYRAIAGVELKFEQYKGVRLIYGGGASVATLASAAVGDRFVLFANHPKVIRDALNNVQAVELGLEASPAYQQALDSLAP
ncbi:MAG: DUF3352 domain-containing protein, partial [Leptolyngbyaceae bacterium]|nr:DUF3352 domain-containing protein [Leptolyngbyaceae bacterium]